MARTPSPSAPACSVPQESVRLPAPQQAVLLHEMQERPALLRILDHPGRCKAGAQHAAPRAVVLVQLNAANAPQHHPHGLQLLRVAAADHDAEGQWADGGLHAVQVSRDVGGTDAAEASDDQVPAGRAQ